MSRLLFIASPSSYFYHCDVRAYHQGHHTFVNDIAKQTTSCQARLGQPNYYNLGKLWIVRPTRKLPEPRHQNAMSTKIQGINWYGLCFHRDTGNLALKGSLDNYWSFPLESTASVLLYRNRRCKLSSLNIVTLIYDLRKTSRARH